MIRQRPRRRAFAVSISVIALSVLSFAVLPQTAEAAARTRPSVGKLQARSGGTRGGERIRITGRGFTHATTVLFGSTRSRSRRVASSKLMYVTVPAHRAGTVAVRVKTRSGTSVKHWAAEYTYVRPPNVRALSVHTGPPAGGAKMTITGTGFTHVKKVVFGASSAPGLRVLSSTRLQVTVPRHALARVDVRVVGTYGTSTAHWATQYSDTQVPSVTALDSVEGPPIGGQTIELTGTRLDGVTQVTFGGVPAIQIDVISPTQVEATTPNHVAGTVDVIASNPFASSPANPGARYRFGAPSPLLWGQPHNSDPNNSSPIALSCASANFCLAVDQSGHARQFNGTTWSSAVIANQYLDTVSCPTDTYCMAGGFGSQVFVYDGTSWSTLDTPMADVRVVACASASFCVAFDYSGDAFRFDGTQWSDTAYQDTSIEWLSCPSATFCLADGSRLATFDGTTWSIEQSSAPGQILAVTCTSSSSCTAVAEALIGGAYSIRAYTFDGTTWSGPSIDLKLTDVSGISCADAEHCAVVGGTSAATLSGTTWSLEPNLVATRDLQGVSCPTATFCAAMTYSGRATEFDGSTWSTPKTFDPKGGSLVDVSCASTSYCMAIDYGGSVMAYDGHAWGAPTFVSELPLVAVSCASSTRCVALTSAGGAIASDGTTWTPLDTPDGADLVRVSCPTEQFCAAVDAHGVAYALDGSTWTGQPLSASALTDISCASASFCVAIGGNHAWTYDGSSWSSAATVDAATTVDLNSVSCPADGVCIAGAIGTVYTFATADGWSAANRLDSARDTLGTPYRVSCGSPTFCAALSERRDAPNGAVITNTGGEWSAPHMLADKVFHATALSCSGSLCIVVGDGWSIVGTLP